MYPNICHIYGPLYFNCYGFFIAIGILIFNFLIQKNAKFNQIITFDKFKNIVFLSVIIAIVGGRLLWVIEDWNSIKNYQDILALWKPGYSFLGSLIGILIFVPLYLNKLNIEIIQFLDVVSIYAPLLHSISRIGCFLAGCCHGIPTNYFWGIVYTHPDVAVPSHLKFIKIHPTQLYAALSLFFIFLMMYYFLQNKFTKKGQMFSLYLIFASLERFFNDFFRSDRDFANNFILKYFSFHQWISLFICFIGIFLFLNSTYKIYFSKKYTIKNL